MSGRLLVERVLASAVQPARVLELMAPVFRPAARLVMSVPHAIPLEPPGLQPALTGLPVHSAPAIDGVWLNLARLQGRTRLRLPTTGMVASLPLFDLLIATSRWWSDPP